MKQFIQSSAFPTKAVITLIAAGILVREFMAAFAMGGIARDQASGFTARWWADATTDIFCEGDCFEVMRIYAGTDTAEMVNRPTAGNWPNHDGIHEAVSACHLRSFPSTDLDLTIPFGVKRSAPEPTARIGLRNEVPEKPLCHREPLLLRIKHVRSISQIGAALR